MPSAVLRRDAQAGGVNQDLCTLWVGTWPWTDCRTFVSDNSLTMDEFVDMNPSIDTDCYGWVGGREYCIIMPRARYISTNGTCGRGGTITCIGSAFGPCCGKDGRCGSTDEFCAIGNCQDGQCPGLRYSTNGTCGNDIGLRCGGRFGSCCSNSGVCGSTEKECGIGNCQSGACVGSTSTSSMATPPPATTSSQPSVVPFSPSPDGTCGGALKYKCTGTDVYYGYCCGARGYCGYTEWECSDRLGCQAEFGLCDETVTATRTTTSSTSATITTAIPTNAMYTNIVTPFGDFRLHLGSTGCVTPPKSGMLENRFVDDLMWIQKCFSKASGYRWAALSNGTECWYGDVFSPSTSNMYSLTSCMVPCTGDSFVGCGGSTGELLLYEQLPAGSPRLVVSVTAGSRTYGNPACYFHPQGTAALERVTTSSSMTVEECAGLAAAQNATYAGIENGNQCWYGNMPSEGLTYEHTTNNCVFTRCAGNALEYCGSVSRILLYQVV
ncbi:hypothetical protein VTK56DRAFT_6547 [Thermocarpiscus australiensis]